MRLLLIPICLASGVMITGCASSRLMPPMAIVQTAPPLECRIPCPLPPSTAIPREQWDGAVFRWGADCKSLHDDCVSALNQRTD